MLRSRSYIAALAAISVLFLVWHLPPRYHNIISLRNIITQQTPEGVAIEYVPGTPKPPGQPYTKTLVVARQQSEDVSWLDTSSLDDINKAVYVVDNASLSPGYEIPKNKGHEAMVYLSYIIDHYDSLSDVSIFVHSHKIAWHNNDLLDSDMSKTVQHLNEAHVTRVGYFNLRCHEEPGCPDWLHLDRPEEELDTHRKMEEQAFSLDVWRELHPNIPPPKAISQPCCAQFAVSRDRIRAIPQSEYIRYRDWILATNLSDIFSGRVMEYSWQFLFAGVPELCPSMHACYCDGFGICFGGGEQYQYWLDLRAKMRTLRAQADEKAGVPGEADELRAIAQVMNERLDALTQEAFERGQDPRSRAMEVGRVWQEGDGY